MNVDEIISEIVKEYDEITWLERPDTLYLGQEKLFFDFNILFSRKTSWNNPRKVLMINGFKNIESKDSTGELIEKLVDYIVISERIDNSTRVLIDIVDADELNNNINNGKDYFFINHKCWRFHFVRIADIEASNFEIIGKIVCFKDLNDFRQSIDISLDAWDDYGYSRVINIHIWEDEIVLRINPHTEEMKQYLLGSGEKPSDEHICSVGNSKYYNFLKKYLTYEVRKQWFNLTNDLAFNLNKLEEISSFYTKYDETESLKLNINPPNGSVNNFFNNSFLRTTSLKEIRDVFHPITLSGSAPDERFSQSELRIKRSIDDTVNEMSYKFEENGEFKGDLSFYKRNKSYLPMNVYAIVGGNGSGKTYKINEIIRKHVKNDNNFSQIIHFSLSPFDNIIDCGDKILIDLDRDEEGNIIYEKVGFVSIKKPLIDIVLNKLDLLKLEDIREYFINEYRKDDKYFLDDNNNLIKSQIHEISTKDSFCWYIQSLLLDLIASEEKLDLWKKALNYFSFEEWAKDIRQAFCDRDIELDDFKKINNLSSGQATILLYLTKLVFSVNQGSLIIFDEPETFMHPPMMKSFIRAVSEIVDTVGAFCLVATHSPVVIQEIPHCNVYKLSSNHEIAHIRYKTYGQNMDTLYKNIYGVELQYTGYNSLLIERAKDPKRNNNSLLFETDIPYLGDEAFLKYLLIKDEIQNISEKDD